MDEYILLYLLQYKMHVFTRDNIFSFYHKPRAWLFDLQSMARFSVYTMDVLK